MKRTVDGKQEEYIDYHVIDSCKVNQKQIRTVESTAVSIVSAIRAKRKPSLSLFPL